MKKIITLLFAFIASTEMMYAVMIDGINYELDTLNFTAAVVSNMSNYTGDISIPDTIRHNSNLYDVTQIASYAFSGCTELTSIAIGNKVKSIGRDAFASCFKLTSVEIGDSVLSIGDYAFRDCSGLTSVTIGNGVTNIEKYAFMRCSAMTSLLLGNSITSIAEYAFYNCSGLTSLVLPESLTSIGYAAFYGCSGLTDVVFGHNISHVREYAFSNCRNLTSIEIPDGVSGIYLYAFDDCPKLKTVILDSDKLTGVTRYWDQNIGMIFGKQVTEYIFGEHVTSIGEMAFRGCANITRVTIPTGIISIGEDAFRDCSGIKTVEWNAINCPDFGYFDTLVETFTFGEEVESIPHACCSRMHLLTSITIPSSVTSIGWGAFYSCTGLTSVTCQAITPPTLEESVFEYVDHSIPLYVPAVSLELYQTAYGWKDFFTILPIAYEALDQTTNDPLRITTKLLCNGQIYILRGDKTYTLQGQEVR